MVSIILRSIEERAGWLGRIVISLIGMAWTVITFLVLPIIVVENLGVGKALKKSGSLVRNTWGENLSGHVGLSIAGFLLILPTIALVAAGFALDIGGVGGVVIGVGVLWGILVLVVMTALAGIYQTALYRFAVTGNLPSSSFSSGTIQDAFYTRRQR